MKQKLNDNQSLKDVIALSFGICIAALLVKFTFYVILGNIVFLFLCLEIGWFRNGVSKIWRTLSHVLGTISSTIILSIIFYLVLFPIALLRKLFLKGKPASPNSTFVAVDKAYSAKDLENLW